jgi:hypothetical protein
LQCLHHSRKVSNNNNFNFYVEDYLEAMQVPEEYEGPKLLTVLRDPKIDPPEYLKFVEIAFGKDAKIKGPVGTFAQEQYNGNFAQNFRKFFEK